MSRCFCFLEYPKKLQMKRTIARRFNAPNFRKPFVCHREGYFPEGHGDGYFKCSRNPDGTLSRIRLRCLGGQFFDNTLKRCNYIIRSRRDLSKNYRFRNHKPHLYSYKGRIREKYLGPFRNRRKRFSFKKWNHQEKSQGKNINDNTITSQSFLIPPQSDLKSSNKHKLGNHVKKISSGYKPSPNFDENLDTAYEKVRNNFDENIHHINNEHNQNDEYTNKVNLFGYVQKKRECSDKPSSSTSSEDNETSSKEDPNGQYDSTTVENFVISSLDSKSNDEGKELKDSLYEHHPKRRSDVNFKISFGNNKKGREEDLVIEIPLNDASQTCNGEKSVINRQNDVESTLSPDTVVKLKQSQQMTTDSSATDMSPEKIMEHRMRLSKNFGSKIDYNPGYHKDDYPDAIFEQRSASDNPKKLLILLGKQQSLLDLRELSKPPLGTIATASTTTTSVSLPTTPSTRCTETTTTTTQSNAAKSTKPSCFGVSTSNRANSTTTKKYQGACPSEEQTTDSCGCSTEVGSFKQVFKHLKDDYISKIHDHNFTTSAPNHRKGHKMGNGHTRPMSFYICSNENSSNSSKGCSSFFLCNSARSGRGTLILKVPCPSGMGFDSNLNKCTRNMGRICNLVPRE